MPMKSGKDLNGLLQLCFDGSFWNQDLYLKFGILNQDGSLVQSIIFEDDNKNPFPRNGDTENNLYNIGIVPECSRLDFSSQNWEEPLEVLRDVHLSDRFNFSESFVQRDLFGNNFYGELCDSW